MKTERHNFEDIKREFYLGRTAPKASRILQSRSDEALFRLLRHHEEEMIDDDETDETSERDYFDYLLAYYSILEIAMMIGFVETLPAADRRLAISELSHPALRRFYEKHYRLRLPGRLLRRLQDGEGEHIQNGDGITTGLFMDFMTLTSFLETDDDIGTFLWFLDGGLREGYRYKDTLRVLQSAKHLARSMSKPPREKDELDRSVEGFGKFLNFCVQFDSILRSCVRWPALQRAMYQCHAYWFVRMRDVVAQKLNKALDAYIDVEAEEGRQLAAFAPTRNSLTRLLSDKYRR